MTSAQAWYRPAPHPRQLRHVEAKEPAKPIVVCQQPLRDVRDGLSANAV
jgi:hypothetical protein